MIDRLYTQMQAMQVLSKSQDVTADNLANINTPGFKGNKLFYRMLTDQVNGRTHVKSEPMTSISLDQGILEPTGNDFDFGINGNGFFVVEDNGENVLTRDGRFHLDSEGYLVNSQNDKVQGESGPIQLQELIQGTGGSGGEVRLEISKDGTLRLNNKQIDKLRIRGIDDAANLSRKGQTYFTANEGNLTDENLGMVMQGYYEKGNVEPLNEMVDMMRNQQMFESTQRAMRTTDDMLSMVTTRMGRF